MNNYPLNTAIGVIGLLIMLIGLLFLSSPTVATPLTGVGGSVLATALVNWILTRRLATIPVTSIVEALAQKTEFMRLDQEAELTFTLHNGRVKLEKRHRYSLRNPRRYTRPRSLSIFDDASPAGGGQEGGFLLVLGPDGTKLEGEALERYVTPEESGKHVFRKTYDLRPGDKNAFEFRSVGYYRLADRLIWTVQDLSENFRVRIKNQTGRRNAFKVKINHHREQDIHNQMKQLDGSDEIIFEFNTEILPYQGFEIMWDLEADSQ